MRKRAGTHVRRRGITGHTLVELTVALAVFAIGSGGMILCHLGAQGLSEANRETEIAVNAALSAVHEVRSVPFAEAFARFNATAADDVPGDCPGSSFAVAGLEPIAGDADGLAGAIRFPGDGVVLSELVDDEALGMPRDLSGDGAPDAADHAGDYVVLPFAVRVEWTGSSGKRSLEIVSTLAREKAP